MVDLFHASHFWGLVREALVDGEVESEFRPSVHALVRLDTEDKVQDVVRIREVRSHRGAE